eukprot:TRINITY_DN8703_c0_g1_i7.p1 TRINITY_DN8703_c0_g1~~TRINITY_DN8703_c0_g1_i7.p1  ORF type:complete len:172 (-),score=25.73 TRINITY_DN8703_c0_g1_i7:230-745(-)
MVKVIIRKSELQSGDESEGGESSGSEDSQEYKCELCGFSTTVQGDLKTHHDLRHLGEDGKLHCTECEFSCKRTEVMKKHLEAQHPDMKTKSNGMTGSSNGGSPAESVNNSPTKDEESIRLRRSQLFTCEECFKAFHSKFVLKTHKKAHEKFKASKNGKIDKYYMYYLYSAA